MKPTPHIADPEHRPVRLSVVHLSPLAKTVPVINLARLQMA
jgi:hypothetical protein